MICNLSYTANKVCFLRLLAVTISGCFNRENADNNRPLSIDSQPVDVMKADHGTEMDLGTLEIAGNSFRVVRFGDVLPGKESAFEVEGIDFTWDQLAIMNLYLWVEDQAGNQLSAPSKGEMEGIGLHFHSTPRKGKGDPYRVVLRVRSGDIDERASLPLDGHGHEHHDGPHHGVIASFSSDQLNGFLELKLHDDSGDLELWLAKDERATVPFDIPLDSKIHIEFIDIAGRNITLFPRNKETNEGEDGISNTRNGKTNYFIFPTAEGEDVSWLIGPEFSSIVVVSFSLDENQITSEEFVLKPHEH